MGECPRLQGNKLKMLLFSFFLALNSVLVLASSSVTLFRWEHENALTYNGKQKDFWEAILSNNLVEVSKYLDDPEVDLAINNNMAFRFACRAGLTDIVRLLLGSKNINPGAHADQAVIYATNEGHLEILKMLLADDRVNPGARDNEAIFVAKDECLAELLKHPKVDPSARDNQLIIDAACGPRPARLSFLLKSKGLNIDPGVRDNEALIATIKYRDYANVSLLCAHEKVDPSARNYEAVRQAAKLGYRKMLRTLLGHRLVDKEEATRVICQAIGCSYSKVWETVFRRIGTDIPMKIAIERGEGHMVKYLLDHHYTPGVWHLGGHNEGSTGDAKGTKFVEAPQRPSSSSSSIPTSKLPSAGRVLPPQAMILSNVSIPPEHPTACSLSSIGLPRNINIPQMLAMQSLSLMPSRPNSLRDAPIYVPTPIPRPPFLSSAVEPASSSVDVTQQMKQLFARFIAGQKHQNPQRQLQNIKELVNTVFQEDVCRLRRDIRGIEERDRKRRRMNSEEEMDVDEGTEDDRK